MSFSIASPALAPAAALLCAMLETDSVPHALLIEGGASAGRKEAALALARILLCAAPRSAAPEADDEASMFGGMSLFGGPEEAREPEPNQTLPCGECAHCVKSAAAHPDFRLIEGGTGAKSFHIDAIRALRQDAYVLPNEAERKVCVLHNAQSMTTEAQNALLKLLEEPPSHACLILTVPARRMLLPTVLSRATAISLGEAVEEAPDPERGALIQRHAEAIAEAMLRRGDDFALLEATAPLEAEKGLAREVLPALRRALHKRLTAPEEDPERVIRLIDGIKELEFSIERNANNNLLLTRLAAKGLES
ncbi:MAG: hypothetical protein FWH26_00275 [Oscillospiraceae bacterium]|nr:hypothetical protein [Oscillospiraceae bacterium]